MNMPAALPEQMVRNLSDDEFVRYFEHSQDPMIRELCRRLSAEDRPDLTSELKADIQREEELRQEAEAHSENLAGQINGLLDWIEKLKTQLMDLKEIELPSELGERP